MEPLHNPIRDYAWGSRSVLASLQGRPHPTPGPEAELWIGAHPGSPSTVDGTPLDALIAAAPSAWVGGRSLVRFGPRLPYLMKVLAAEAPLSLQAHPDAERARARFAAGDPNYVDGFHKPELLVALTPFEALCGFRPYASSAASLSALGLDEVAAVVGRGDLATGVRMLLGLPASRVLALAGGDPLSARLADAYPGDPGALVALLLHHVVLEPGEAVWMPAGNLHAYLRGVGVEIMAASDNVLRGGLTPKRVDVDELLSVLRFTVLESPVMASVPVGPGVVTWPVPVPDFALHRVTVGGSPVSLAPPGPRIALCTAGAVTVDDGAGPVPLTPAHAAIGRAGGGPLVLSGAGEVFVASLGA